MKMLFARCVPDRAPSVSIPFRFLDGIPIGDKGIVDFALCSEAPAEQVEASPRFWLSSDGALEAPDSCTRATRRFTQRYTTVVQPT